MLQRIRRALALGLAASLVAAVGVALPATAPSPVAAQATGFYTPPSPLPAGRNGDVIKSERITYTGAATNAWRVMYLSRDAKNQPMPVTGTVLVPTAPWTGGGQRPLVAYAPFTAGMGDQCAVSKNVSGEVAGDLVSGVQTGFINALLAKGFAVVQTDYQGLGTPGDHTYVMRLPQGQAVLDSLRAAQRLPGTGLPTAGPVGVAGYSQGGGASAAAAELEPTYAPELDLRGAYAAASPADLAVLGTSLDGSLYFGFLLFAVIGANSAYPEAGIITKINQQGVQTYLEANSVCTFDAVFRFPYRQTNTLTLDARPLSAHMAEEPFRTIVAQNRLGQVRPGAPVLVEHALFDDVLPYEQGKQMARDWCTRGGTVQFADIYNLVPFFTHLFTASFASTNAANWLQQRFAGTAPTSNCGWF